MRMIPMDDRDAIQKCKMGERDAYRFIVERYQCEAIGHALSILGNKEDALDAVQEAFLAAYMALGRFDLEKRFYPWFYTVLRHCCFKLIARVRNRVAMSIDDVLLKDTDHSDKVDATIMVGKALQGLSPEDREILTLRHWDGLSYDELAERLQIPRGTVMSRLFTARRRVRRFLVAQSGRRITRKRYEGNTLRTGVFGDDGSD